jgi:drug/metabolite transporter (DMT)-like permease
MLGLVAALLWGVHDFAVRKVGGRADAAVLLVLAFLFGAVLLVPMAVAAGGWASLTPAVLRLALAAGACYAFAGYGQYRAFTIGPVRLVAAITGAFPLLSVGIAVLRGQEVGVLVWLGAMAVVLGIAVVAQGKGAESNGSRMAAVGWAVLASTGYAATFGLAQFAVEEAADLPVSLVVRMGAIAVVLSLIVLRRPEIRPALALWRPMLLIGALDVSALTLVTVAGGFANPEYASVAASIFGIITILLAWRLLAEPMTATQWLGVLTVFGGVVVLGLA